jgi:hypothetical protein
MLRQTKPPAPIQHQDDEARDGRLIYRTELPADESADLER